MTGEEAESVESDRAFGASSRRQLLTAYFSEAEPVSAQNAWKHLYRLLLWTDRTTGLAHCYESDKAQPGRKWYERSLAFHDWLAISMESSPHGIGAEIDWLFRRGTEKLATNLAKHATARDTKASQQRAPYTDRGFPEPGEDAALEAIIVDELKDCMASPPIDVLRRLTQRIRLHFGHENKRKNLVGEGFEDALSEIINRLPGSEELTVAARPLLHSLPGFRLPPGKEKPRKVDLALVSRSGRRTLVSAKWSIRADREEQFGVDFDAYARLESDGRDFDFVLITNEFDAARLTAACDRRTQNSALFAKVVHVNPQGPLAAYGKKLRRSAKRLGELVEEGRLSSLEEWLASLAT